MIAKNKWGKYSIPEEVNYTYNAKYILNGGVHEDTTIDFIRSISGTIIHAGAGFGDFLPGLKNCDRVITFEPNPLMYKSALETIKLNNISNVEIYPHAIGNHDGTSLLKIKDHSGIEMGPRSEINDKSGEQVKMVKLDSFINKQDKISLIHLDLEGYEFEAIMGAKDIIERDKPIIVLEIDQRAVTYNDFMLKIGYLPHKQLIFNSNDIMVFVNTVYVPIERKSVDSNYWSSELLHPLSPNGEDVEIYKQNKVSGTTLLLGLTKNLTKLSDWQMDINPWIDSDTVIKSNWIDNTTFYDNIIGDGVLSFNRETTNELVKMAKNNCKVFITRAFTKRLPIMRIADYFPQPEDFEIKPSKTIKFKDYSFYIWHF